MELIDIIRKAQKRTGQKQTIYCKKLFDTYKEFILKQFTIYSPYTENDAIRGFVTTLALEFFEVIKNKIYRFKLKKNYSREELEEHLWNYLQTIADSLLDRTLVHLSLQGENETIRGAAENIIEKKYRNMVEALISERIRNSESPATVKLDGFELEEFWKEETLRLISLFYKNKFKKITVHFEKDNSNAIFRNYVDRAVKNFLTDDLRAKSVKTMRRIVLYRDDLPETLFETLKELKGFGNLFYYKKKQDCLTIRDTYKALSVLKSLNLPKKLITDMDLLFKKNRKRAEYQKIIDNIGAYILEKCPDEVCKNRLTPAIITILLYTGDAVMKKRLSITDNAIARAGQRLEKCVTCLKMDRKEIFYRI